MTAKLLIVDDDADARALLQAFAADEGYAFATAASGEDALLLLDTFLPDIILLDAVMPLLDGFETCRRIKARESTAQIPVIFMTGLSETEHVVRGLAAGGVDYVTKPVVLDELAARIRVHLANARTTRSALSALDSVDTLLLSCDDAGRIGWATPEAQALLDAMDPSAIDGLQLLLCGLTQGWPEAGATFDWADRRYEVTQFKPGMPGERLFKIVRSTEGIEPQLLRQAFGLTPREADVLLWIAHGKSNRDISEILNISARTVNKHLEQVFIKIGVENRASAAAAATRALLQG